MGVENPEERQYSCHSSSHSSFSFIDLALAFVDFGPVVATVDYLPRAFSDHSHISITLSTTDVVT